MRRRETGETHASKKNFHKIENNNPCNPLHRILVLRPRPNKPKIPSARITFRAAWVYETSTSLTWRYVLTTLSEFDTESDTTDATNPMNASRRSQRTSSSSLEGGGIAESSVLYYSHARYQQSVSFNNF